MPDYWKHIIFKESEIEFKGYKLDIYSYECKESYNELLKTIVCMPEQYVIMWENILGIEINEIDWYNSYSYCFKWSISTKLRSFYYQLRVGHIMTNCKLVKMKLRDDASCQWCPCDNQTLLHMFWECKTVRDIWDKLSLWISDSFEKKTWN